MNEKKIFKWNHELQVESHLLEQQIVFLCLTHKHLKTCNYFLAILLGFIHDFLSWFKWNTTISCRRLCFVSMTAGVMLGLSRSLLISWTLAGSAEVPSAPNHMMSTFFFFKRGGLDRHNYSFCLRVFIHLSQIPSRAIRLGRRKCFVLMII